jgi:hypothetical protein
LRVATSVEESGINFQGTGVNNELVRERGWTIEHEKITRRSSRHTTHKSLSQARYSQSALLPSQNESVIAPIPGTSLNRLSAIGVLSRCKTCFASRFTSSPLSSPQPYFQFDTLWPLLVPYQIVVPCISALPATLLTVRFELASRLGMTSLEMVYIMGSGVTVAGVRSSNESRTLLSQDDRLRPTRGRG